MKLFQNRNKKKTEIEKVQERREEVLANGRKFKYPLQWTKHRVVANTFLIAIVVIALLVTGGWYALYRLQRTDDFLYRVTQVLPASVAEVDGEKVRFSDYLMLYRSSIISMERQAGSLDEESVNNMKIQYKKDALLEAEKYAYAQKIGKEMNITVSEDEISEAFERHRQVGGIDRSKESFLKIVEDNFGMSESEYRRMLYLSLMEAKVSETIDTEAGATADEVAKMLKENGGNFGDVANALGDKVVYEETGGLVSDKNIDGGRAVEAMKLEEGEYSERFISTNGDGYYFVKLIDKNDSEANFVSIKISFKKFNENFNELVESEKIREFITIE